MWSEARLSVPSRLLVLGVVIGFVMVAAGFVAYRLANMPTPPNAPYDPNRYYRSAVDENWAGIAAGLGAILIVLAMFLLGVTGKELNPQVRKALIFGGGMVLIAFALLFARYPYIYAFG